MPTDPLFNILRAYATLQPPRLIQKPEVHFNATHQFLLQHLLLNPHFKEYPPSQQYQMTFWKWAIEWLESIVSDEDELDERIYTELTQVMSSKSVDAARPSASYLTYLWPSDVHTDHHVYPGYANATLLEARTTIENGTTGLRTWSASLILAQLILSDPDLVTDKRVLELGCGVGFLGIIAGSMQAEEALPTVSSLWLTDLNERVLQQCETNLRLPCNVSHRHADVNVQALDWSDVTDPARRPGIEAFLRRARPNIILGADLVYDPSIIPPLVNILVLATRAEHSGHGLVAYIALAVRNEETITEFLRQARQELVVQDVGTNLVAHNIFTGATEFGQDASTQAVKIFKFQNMDQA